MHAGSSRQKGALRVDYFCLWYIAQVVWSVSRPAKLAPTKSYLINSVSCQYAQGT